MKKKTVSVCITEPEYEALVLATKTTGLAKSDIIRRAMDEFFARQERNNQ